MDASWLTQPLLSSPVEVYGTSGAPTASGLAPNAPPENPSTSSSQSPAPPSSTGRRPPPTTTSRDVSTPQNGFLSPAFGSILSSATTDNPSTASTSLHTDSNDSNMASSTGAAATSMGSAAGVGVRDGPTRAGEVSARAVGIPSPSPTAYYGVLSSSSLLADQAPAAVDRTVQAAASPILPSSAAQGMSREDARRDEASSSSSPEEPPPGSSRFQLFLSLLRRVTGASNASATNV